VSIIFPQSGDDYSTGTAIKIKATATDPDGSISQVRFLADTNVIGVATNAPFNAIWSVGPKGNSAGGFWNLKAVASDDQGAEAESDPVKVFYVTGRPPGPILEIISPSHQSLFATPATFDFIAELLASTSGTIGPVDFYVGADLVQRVDRQEPFAAATPPYSIIVSNLSDGTYELRARYMGADWPVCTCRPITISVVKLGVQRPSVAPDGRFQFEVVTSFLSKDTIIQTSPNLQTWTSISTNVPSTNVFQFIEPSLPLQGERFYRVVVPP
jgi:hypothetical protein